MSFHESCGISRRPCSRNYDVFSRRSIGCFYTLTTSMFVPMDQKEKLAQIVVGDAMRTFVQHAKHCDIATHIQRMEPV